MKAQRRRTLTDDKRLRAAGFRPFGVLGHPDEFWEHPDHPERTFDRDEALELLEQEEDSG
jgi:hypothetical protein